MTNEEIEKAFENRWRIKSERLGYEFVYDPNSHYGEGMVSYRFAMDAAKEICRDFFEAGILLGQGFRKDEITFPDGQKGTVVYKWELDTDTLDGGFSIFWELYEKKVGRPKCEKLWSKLTAKEREECIAYIPLYKQAQPDKQYRKNPETFLRNKCWNDELIYHNNGEPTKQSQTDKLADILVG